MKKYRKEIWLVILAIIVVLGLWGILKTRNNKLESKIETTRDSIDSLKIQIEELKIPVEAKHNVRLEFYEQVDNNYDLSKFENQNEFWKRTREKKEILFDQLSDDIKSQFGFYSKESFIQFVSDNSYTHQDVDNFNEAKRLEEEEIPNLKHNINKLINQTIDIHYFLKNLIIIVVSILIITITVLNFDKIKKHKKVIGFATIIIIVILVITNPTLKNFKEFNPIGFNDEQGDYRRSKNYLIFSIYEKANKKYLGILKNFFELKK